MINGWMCVCLETSMKLGHLGLSHSKIECAGALHFWAMKLVRWDRRVGYDAIDSWWSSRRRAWRSSWRTVRSLSERLQVNWFDIWNENQALILPWIHIWRLWRWQSRDEIPFHWTRWVCAEAASDTLFCRRGVICVFLLICSINLDAYLIDDAPKNNPARVQASKGRRGRGRGRGRN